MPRDNGPSSGGEDAASKRTRKRPPTAAGNRVYTAPALDKGLEILELLAEYEGPVAMTDVASALGRSSAEIYRMFHVLESRGYVVRSSNDGRYSISERLFQLGMRNAPKRNLHQAALPVMQALAEKSLQSCHVGVISGNDIVVIAREESPGAVSFTVRLGYRVPIVASTSGRVVFAFQGPDRQRDWLKDLRTHNPGASIAEFKGDIALIAERGYALEPSRFTEGIQDIGAPIIAPTGEAIASLTMPFVSHRRFEVDIVHAIPLVVDAAKEISARLAAK